MKKKIIIFLIVVIVAVVSIVFFLISKDLKQEQLLNNEIEEILSYFDDVDINLEALNNKLNSTITKGDYAIVETAIKTYIKDYLDDFEITMVNKKLNDSQILAVISIDNYKVDGPNFTNTIDFLNNNLEFLNNKKQIYIDYMSKEKIMSYIEQKNINEYYINYYQKKMIDGDMAVIDMGYEESIAKITNILSTSKDIIDLLNVNKQNWHIDNDQIVFSSEQVLNEYKVLFNNLQTIN